LLWFHVFCFAGKLFRHFHLFRAASNQGNRRSLLGEKRTGKKGKKNNQAAQAIDQSKLFGGGIQQGQAASNQD
jgi:hypothetical protein